jgi:hypothetical protein
MDYITILGTCRQIPITQYLPMSQILEKLNYPQYTKEILQEIRYLKYKNLSTETKYCFRSSLLNKCVSEISDIEYNNLKCEFDKTTFFLIEICARTAYKWNNVYLHRIAEDPQYEFINKDDIIKEFLTDEEIENDILQIKNELYPKPFIIISHFATYEQGSRYELTQLLKKICQRLNIPFLNQSDIIKLYGTDIIVKEPKLVHYNAFGQHIVGKILLNKINEVKSYID